MPSMTIEVPALLTWTMDSNALQASVSNFFMCDTSGKVGPVVQYLLSVGADPNLPPSEKYGYALHAACVCDSQHSAQEVVRLLLSHGADINARGGKYETAMECAAKHGQLEMVKVLLKNGAEAVVDGGKYGSPIQAAREKKHWHVVDFLDRFMRNTRKERNSG
jgi:hypothetical protein